MSLRADYDERAISQATAFLADPPGIRAALDATGQLAGDPRPGGSFPCGSPGLRRLRIGRYRVLDEIGEDAIAIGHIARASLQTACGHASWRRVSTASRLAGHGTVTSRSQDRVSFAPISALLKNRCKALRSKS